MPNKKFKIITAMSGGVDSSIAAALLKKQGHDVIGLFLLMGNNQNPKDAKKIAKELNIPLKVLDVRKEFKKKVVDYLIEEYKKGRTPNPCVECNRWIKFRFLFKKMMELKADYIATGHYSRIKDNRLLVAKDKNKDQSYFLWTLNRKQLKRILFPVGDYTKTQIRAMAKNLPVGRQGWDLPVYEKTESQEICFLDTNLYKFLKSRIHTNKGPIITTKGDKVGQHQGLAYYTIGQRKGIKIGGIGPFYVVDKDFKKNALIVAQGDFDDALFKKEMRVKNVNWISGKEPRLPLRCRVKIRYLTEAVSATVSRMNANKGTNNYKYIVKFNKKQRAITPGQSAVFYSRDEVLGGGVIM